MCPALPDDNHQLGSAEQPEQEKKLPNQPFVLKCVTRFSNRSMNKPFYEGNHPLFSLPFPVQASKNLPKIPKFRKSAQKSAYFFEMCYT